MKTITAMLLYSIVSTVSADFSNLKVYDGYYDSYIMDGTVTDLNGAIHNIGSFYEQTNRTWNVDFSYDWLFDDELFRMNIHTTNGYKSQKLEIDHFVELGFQYVLGLNNNDALMLSISSINIGASINETPCYDDLNREFSCITAQSFAEDHINHTLNKPQLMINYIRRF
jgi:hypothetical protein